MAFRTHNSLSDEIPHTKEGLRIYIKELQKEFDKIDPHHRHVEKNLKEAKRRFDDMINKGG